MNRRALCAFLLLPVLCLAQGYGGGYGGGYGNGYSSSYALPGSIPPASNLVADSWQWESAAWGGASASCTVTPGLADPFGGLTASTLVSAIGTGSWSENGTNVSVASNDVVFGVRIKSYSMANGQKSVVRMYHVSSGNLAAVGVTWNGSGVATIDAANTGGSGDLIGKVTGHVDDLGGGWYYIWFYLDLSGGTRYGNYGPRLLPWLTGTTVGQGIYAVGVQMEYGTAPGPRGYLQKP